MRPLPFVWPYALAFWAIYAWVFVPEFRVVSKASSAPQPAEDRGSLRVVLMGFNISIFAAFLVPFLVRSAALPGNRIAWFYAGLITLVAGSLLRRHCFRVLGAFFTGAVTIQSDHRVIDAGAYRWLRHPSYSAALLIVLGIGMCLGNWLGIAISFTVAFAAYSYRARVEEQALLASLGPAYAQFLASRKRFLPFIY
jgi:protein-S-isoprenylcysteine O-methyltransferase Ste14